MSFGGDCLINKINQQIAALEGSTYESSQLAGSARSSLEKSYCCVTNISDLPSAACNKGRFIYVTACRSFRYSDGYEWLMNACSVLGNVNTATALWSWGCNNCGQLGDGTTLSRCSPGTVAGGGITWCQISGGGAFTLAIKTDGTLWAWGNNTTGSLGDGTTVSRSSPGTIAGGGTNWCQTIASAGTIQSIKTDGTLWTWGSNCCGVLGDGTTVSRCSPGTVAGGGSWCLTSGGQSFSVAIKTDGTLWTWGRSYTSGSLGDGTTSSRSSPGTIAGGGTTWCQVSSGAFHISALKCDGTIWTWGRNSGGQLGDGTTLDRCSPTTVAGAGTDWCQVSGSSYSTLAIKCDGTLWTWGCNSVGRLGDGTTTNRSSPGTIAGGGTNWCWICSGFNSCHASAIKTDGTLWTWGLNSRGQLGDGTVTNRCSPGTIAGGGTNWCEASGGRYHTIALKSRGF